ncbi:Ser/Thr protein kinase RdoA (MazF antagonist) [Roseiarcus fermentans]|uniref:Hydroxylysine kinase n=1 Tax=Roseiarcus fermentans TaxID=1473586 RepID=A0A366F6V6_9HYPH|nr:phosphotransferase [Roseiarcus fermentans]RBP09876.1 Ser/Thr protein kinase RdoA (MazF antagonist) [Roseiarcus fermentans]
MSRTDAILATILSTPSPRVSESEAVDIAREHFGLETSAKRLASERDEMFRLRDATGVDSVLKITNPAESPDITNLQTAALLWIAGADPHLPVPRVCKTLGGATAVRVAIGESAPRTVRLLSFLQGRSLHETPRTRDQRRELGSTLARLGLALANFRHPSADYELAWDIKHAHRLEPLLASVRGREKFALAQTALHRFEAAVRPRLPGLRTQVVHNDFSTHNVLVDPTDPDRVAGVIDFGDLVRTQLVNDVAIGAAHHLSASADALEGPRDFIDAYQSVIPLSPDEFELLPDLIATRFLVTVLVTGWRAERYPENRDYILKNNALAWDGLDRLSHMSSETARQRFCAN